MRSGAARSRQIPNILQRTITLNDRALSVVGVMPPGFNGVSFDTDVWVPWAMLTLTGTPRLATDCGSRWLLAVARLKDGVSLEPSRRDLDRVAAALEQQYPASNRQRGVQIDTLHGASSATRAACCSRSSAASRCS